MNVRLSIVQSLLAVTVAASGVLKTTRFRERLNSQLPWLSDTPDALYMTMLMLLAATGITVLAMDFQARRRQITSTCTPDRSPA
ncbi:hypothetical protein ACIBMX_35235 [Streptomyces phaeochromogenes]|uniref:hypothetical protein n=1 Tax=Streptomyces phaeochromogenes TaxID=1923 RepID=UPI00340BDD2E